MEKQASDLDPNPGFIIDQDLQVDPQKNSLVSLCKRKYQGTVVELNIGILVLSSTLALPSQYLNCCHNSQKCLVFVYPAKHLTA